jgi:hypothetical protein
MGKEFRGKGTNVHLGPAVGPLGRKPLGGRNWEGFGADPVLQAKAAALHIQGIQEQGIIATIKHFIGNEQEMFRMYNPLQPGYSANIGKMSLMEPAMRVLTQPRRSDSARDLPMAVCRGRPRRRWRRNDGLQRRERLGLLPEQLPD